MSAEKEASASPSQTFTPPDFHTFAPSPPHTFTVSSSHGRLCILSAALLWSTGGAFTKVLTQDTFAGLNEPPIESLRVGGYDLPVQIACYRVLFAGLTLLPDLRRADISFRPAMIFMAICFVAMNVTYVSAMALGTAANAILLQYSAPLWMFLASVFWLGEKVDRRSLASTLIGLGGVGVIVAGGWQREGLDVVALALGSGVAYAGILIGLRICRDFSSRWLTVWNHLWSALLLLPLLITLRPPTPAQFAVLVVFGSVQLGLAYWLMARGLQTVSAQEAGTITLIEPILNPLWAYLVSPSTEVPHPLTFVGGVVILGALAWRYWPRRTQREQASVAA